jgi:hypothetical protein
MSIRGTEILRSLCRLMIRQNREGRLKSGLNERNSAIQTANDVLALTKLRPSRPWIDNDELDHVIALIRKTASERRLGANVRAQAIRRLAFVELGAPELGHDPTDDLIRKFLAAKQETTAPVVPSESSPHRTELAASLCDFGDIGRKK